MSLVEAIYGPGAGRYGALACAYKTCPSTLVRSVRTRRGSMFVCSSHEKLLKDAGEVLGALDPTPIGRAELLSDAPVRPARPAPPRLVRVEPPPPPATPPDTDTDTDTPPENAMPPSPCRWQPCDSHVKSLGFCNKHFLRVVRLGLRDRFGTPTEPTIEEIRALWDERERAHREQEAGPAAAPGAIVEAAASVALDGDTHSASCWREHPVCAVARLIEVLTAIGSDGRVDELPADIVRGHLDAQLAATRAQRDEMEARVDAVNEALDEAGVDPDDKCETEADAVRKLAGERDTAAALFEFDRKRLRDALAHALGHTDGAGDTSDEDLLAELKRRLEQHTDIRPDDCAHDSAWYADREGGTTHCEKCHAEIPGWVLAAMRRDREVRAVIPLLNEPELRRRVALLDEAADLERRAQEVRAVAPGGAA